MRLGVLVVPPADALDRRAPVGVRKYETFATAKMVLTSRIGASGNGREQVSATGVAEIVNAGRGCGPAG
jgi:hypothetical protein